MTLEDGTQVRRFDNEQEFIDYLVIKAGYDSAADANINLIEHNPLDQKINFKELPYYPIYATSEDLFYFEENYGEEPPTEPISTMSFRQPDNVYAIINNVLWYQIDQIAESADYSGDIVYPACKIIYQGI